MAKARSKKDLETDQKTRIDTLEDAGLESATVVLPKKSRKVPLNMRIEPEAIELSKQIAARKHLDGYTQLLRIYIWESLERDLHLLSKK